MPVAQRGSHVQLTHSDCRGGDCAGTCGEDVEAQDVDCDPRPGGADLRQTARSPIRGRPVCRHTPSCSTRTPTRAATPSPCRRYRAASHGARPSSSAMSRPRRPAAHIDGWSRQRIVSARSDGVTFAQVQLAVYRAAIYPASPRLGLGSRFPHSRAAGSKICLL